jgi:ubiquinone/menaquinone biosynthesis C-methylase UbiE
VTEPVNIVLADYYERRAPDYDDVYAVPERQADLQRLREVIPALFEGRDVLEVAAGTGYWTQVISATAKFVCATDHNPAPLAVAAAREYARRNVRFDRADAFALDQVPGTFNAAFVGFWWSHVLLSDIDRFLHGVCGRLQPGSTIAIIDNRYVEGSSGPIIRTDAAGNTYQCRLLRDDTSYEILKNFPSARELRAAADRRGRARGHRA